MFNLGVTKVTLMRFVSIREAIKFKLDLYVICTYIILILCDRTLCLFVLNYTYYYVLHLCKAIE